MNTSRDIGYRVLLARESRSDRDYRFLDPLPLLSAVLFLILLAGTSSFAAGSNTPFGYGNVVEKARQLAEKPFQESGKVPEILLKMNYDGWRNIRFKPEGRLWRTEKLPFEVHFFHPGFLYNRMVTINIVQSGSVKQVQFTPELFNYGVPTLGDKLPEELGFAGFSLYYTLNVRERHDAVAVFLGASYFRAVGAGEGFGLSARGLAIDTAETSGEEFPYFTEFWLVRPAPGADRITVYALLDSPSVTGGYEFIILPGKDTVMNITSTLFLRKEGKKLGFAPLTSMFFYGENINILPADDFRQEVHDSDGLMIASGAGEWIWRPLINPKRLLVTSFELNNPKGFGLLQRDRNFDHYQDLESHYEKRPDLWVIPQKGWAKGRVELVEIPTENDRNDNIVSYWVPESFPATLSYQLRWGPVNMPPLGRVVATRTSTGNEKGVKLYLIDFEGGKLRSLAPDAHVKAVVSVGRADLIGQEIEKNSVTGGWRLVLHVKKKERALEQIISKVGSDDQPVELRASLLLGNEMLTETWSHVDPL